MLVTENEKSSNILESLSAAGPSTSELHTCVERESPILRVSNSASSHIPGSITQSDSNIIPKLIQPIPLNSSQNNLQPKNFELPAETNASVESNVSTEVIFPVYFVPKKTKKHHQKKLPLSSSDKQAFLAESHQENNNYN